ncbi:MAG: hypothetical protein EA421_08615 [Gemmatimonadales bacterium]|nr:MAG: hypothetical protein EA421_08615 [Gemmatimonadales bacterium]
MMKHARRLALGVAVLLVAAGCSDVNDVAAPTFDAPEGALFSAEAEPQVLASSVYSEVWDGIRGLDSERCDKVGEGPRGPEGWMHWIFATKGASTDASLTLGGTGSGTYEPGEPLEANTWHFYTPFFELDGLTAEIHLNGAPGTGGGLVLSDYCPGGKTLDVTKTADTKFTREHKWDIDKKVETDKGFTIGEDKTPKIWLYTDGSGDETATWKVDVTYEGYEDRDFVIFGDITIKNISTDAAPKSVTSIVDDIGIPGYGNVLVSCTDGADNAFTNANLPRDIAQGETWNCTYRVEITDGDAKKGDQGTNVVKVRVAGETDPYVDTDPWMFDAPTTEINKTVQVTDHSDLFGDKLLGSVTAPNKRTFTYDRDFAWADYGADECGSYQYDNTAKIVETGQEADATLKVNVQCFIDETAYAKGMVPPALQVDSFCEAGFSQWGWTNKIAAGSYSWPMWAGAGQCDTSRGERVGKVDVTYATGSFSAIITLEPGYTLLEEHVYAGSTQFPQVQQGRRRVNTVAPGQYYIEGNLSGDIWVIVHGVVGFPDPNFGPAL